MKRVLLKLSGEALAGDKKTGFDEPTVVKVAKQVKALSDQGMEIGIVIGGGNCWRGRSSENIDRTKADQIGMLATIMNCIYVSEIFRSVGMMTNILTPFDGGKTNFRARPCLFKNRFPIEARIITQNIDKVEKQEIINNIKAALYANLSAAKLDFGEEISTEEVTNIILTADPRISNVSHIENLSFETYAIYWNGVKFREINLTKPLISNAEFIEKAKSDSTIKKSDYNLKYFIESTYPNAQIELNEDTDSPWNDINSPFYINNWARIKFKCSTDAEGNIK